jgi:replication-associated recombination protein RarA
MLKQLWWQKYRPNTVKNFIWQNKSQKTDFKKFIDEKSFPPLLLHGVKGTGKTTLAQILINALVPEEYQDSDVLKINGSTEGGIDNMRSLVQSHVNRVPMGDFKVVFVDEADGLTQNSQKGLRGMIEQCDHNARFILTCNYINSLSPEFRDRFRHYKFNKLQTSDLMEVSAKILLKEGISLDSNEDLECLKQYVELYSHSLRQLIIALEVGVQDGKLQPPTIEDTITGYGVELIEILNKNDWITAREYIAGNVHDEDYIDVYRFLYEYLEDIDKFSSDKNKWKRGIVIISDYMYRHAIHPDPEINFAGCLIKLAEV